MRSLRLSCSAISSAVCGPSQASSNCRIASRLAIGSAYRRASRSACGSLNSAAAGAAVWKRSGGGADGPLLRGCGARGAGGAVAGCGEALEALDALSAARLLADLVDAPAAARTRKSGIQPGNFCCSAALESPAPVDLRRLGRSESGVFSLSLLTWYCVARRDGQQGRRDRRRLLHRNH